MGGAEPINQTFIEKSFLVWDRALSDEFVRSQTWALAEACNKKSVWNNISKLVLAVEKLKTSEKISFGIASITHHVLSGYGFADSYGKRELEGKTRHDLGVLGLLGEKYDLRNYMCKELAPLLKLSVECQAFLRSWADSNHEFYYKKFGGPRLGDKVDKTWMGTHTPAEQKFIVWVEEMTHKVKHDGNIKARVLAMKTSREMIESAPFKEERDAIEKERMGELAANDKSQAAKDVDIKDHNDGNERDASERPGRQAIISMDLVLGIEPVKEGDTESMDNVLKKQIMLKKLKDEDPDAKLSSFMDEAAEVVDYLASFIVEPDSPDAFAEVLKLSGPGRIRGSLHDPKV